MMAAVFGPLWGAARGAWGFFWTFLVLELFAFVQIGRGLWGELGADQLAKYEKLLTNIAKREQQAKDALAAGDQAAADTATKVAGNLQRVADKAKEQADLAANEATTILLVGIGLLILFKIIEGFYANISYEKQYLKWRANPSVQSGISRTSAAFGVFLSIAIWPLTIFRFTVSDPDGKLANWTGGFFGERFPITEFPVGKEYFAPIAKYLDDKFDVAARDFGNVFDGITLGIRTVLDFLELMLIETPWPVVMIVIVVMALRLAGIRVAIFTAAALLYLAFMGLWEISMITVALIGAGAFLCVIIGIPLGIWFGKSERAYKIAEPVLDFMQTMPAFVYLIPIIAFFGTGKPPGVLATLIFAMPPVIRLTALGMRGVPEVTKEAARAFGCSQVATAAGRGTAAGHALHHDRHQPDHPDEPFHGGDRLSDRCRRARRADPGGPTVRGQGPRPARRPGDSVLRHGDRPHRPGHVSAQGGREVGAAVGRNCRRRDGNPERRKISGLFHEAVVESVGQEG